jgi:DNA-directed RNA polymerase specialized sigma24 family protein
LKGSAHQQEEQLLIEAAQQDPSRFAELYELHFERVYAYIARRVRERSAGEELTSHVFHRALANLGKFKWRGAPFAAWLFRIAANSIADRAQRLLRESVRDPAFQASALVAGPEPSHEQMETLARVSLPWQSNCAIYRARVSNHN